MILSSREILRLVIDRNEFLRATNVWVIVIMARLYIYIYIYIYIYSNVLCSYFYYYYLIHLRFKPII